MRIFGFLDQKRSKTIQILSQNFDCYGVIKGLYSAIFRTIFVRIIGLASNEIPSLYNLMKKFTLFSSVSILLIPSAVAVFLGVFPARLLLVLGV